MTRDGRFSMNENGELMSIEGHPVLDAGGAPIQLDPRNGPPKAGADGSLRQNDQLVGAIGLFNFDPGENFVRYGNSGIMPARAPEPVVDRIRRRRRPGLRRGIQRQSGAGDDAADHGPARLREHRGADAADRQTSTDDAIKTLGSKS